MRYLLSILFSVFSLAGFAQTGIPTNTTVTQGGAISVVIVGGSVGGGTLNPTGVTPGTYGSAASIPQLTIGADGRVVAVTPVAVSIPAPTTTLAGLDNSTTDYRNTQQVQNLIASTPKAASGVTGLSPVATSGAYGDLSGRPNSLSSVDAAAANKLNGLPSDAISTTAVNATFRRLDTPIDWTTGVANKPVIPSTAADVGALPVSQSATTADAQTGTNATRYMTPQRTAEAIAALTPAPTLQAETVAYISRIGAAGGRIDAATINAVDKFWVTGKTDGWASLLVDVWCPLGSNLAASLVKLVAAPGSPTSLSNVGFVEADYTQKTGFGVSGSNTTKYLTTGVNPASLSMVSNNISFGTITTDPTGQANFHFGLTPATGTTTMFVGADNAAFFPAYVQDKHAGIGMKMGAFLPNESNIIFDGVTATSKASGIGSAQVINTEINIFRTSFLGSMGYSGGKLGFAFLAYGMTNAQARSLSRAAFDLNIAAGRFLQVGGRLMGFGDSITSGATATTPANRWTAVLATLLGAFEYNAGSSSSELRQTVVAATGGFQRYTDLAAIDVNTIACMYGINDCDAADATTNGDATIIADFTSKLSTMVASWKARGLRVVLAFPYSTRSTDTKRAAYAAAIGSVAVANNVPFADCNSAAMDTGSPGTYLADVVHPNNAGHLLYANTIFAAMQGRVSRSPLLDFPSITAGASSDLTVTVYGAKVGMTVSLGEPATPVDGLTLKAFVSSNNVVTIRATPSTTMDPPAFRVRATVFLDQYN